MSIQVSIGLNAAIVAVTEEVPRLLTVSRSGRERNGLDDGATAEARISDQAAALPFGPLDPIGDRTLELGLRRWVREQTGIEIGYAEQLYTFGDRNRDPRERSGAPRVVSIGYLALVQEDRSVDRLRSDDAEWRDWYDFLPWEDWREGRPEVIDRRIAPSLSDWVDAAEMAGERSERRERCEIAFGLGGVTWDGERVLDRYELLYEVGLVEEAWRDHGSGRRFEDSLGESPAAAALGCPMALDHRRIASTALGRLRGKLRYRPVVFELVPPSFTLLTLQRTVEALAGVRLHKQNFRRLVEKAGLVEGTGRMDHETGGRPAEIFQFRREVLRERPAPGVGLPGTRR